MSKTYDEAMGPADRKAQDEALKGQVQSALTKARSLSRSDEYDPALVRELDELLCKGSGRLIGILLVQEGRQVNAYDALLKARSEALCKSHSGCTWAL